MLNVEGGEKEEKKVGKKKGVSLFFFGRREGGKKCLTFYNAVGGKKGRR